MKLTRQLFCTALLGLNVAVKMTNHNCPDLHNNSNIPTISSEGTQKANSNNKIKTAPLSSGRRRRQIYLT